MNEDNELIRKKTHCNAHLGKELNTVETVSACGVFWMIGAKREEGEG